MSKIYSRIIKVVLASYLIVNGAVWTLSPVVIDHYLSSFLTSKNVQLSEETSIRYNPFISQLYISQLEILDSRANENNSLLSIPSATIEVGLFKLLANRIVIEKFEIDGLQADLDQILTQVELITSQDTSSTESTAPIKATKPTEVKVADSSKPESETKKEPKFEAEEEKSWLSTAKFELPKLLIKNATLLFTLAEDKQSIKLNNLVISDVILSQLQQSADATLTLLVNQAPLELNAKLQLNDGIGQLEYGVNLTKLDLHQFKSALLAPLNTPVETVQSALTQTATTKEFNDIEGLLSFKLQQNVVFDQSKISSQIKGVQLQLTDFALMQTGTENRKVAISDLQFKDGTVELSTPHSLLSLFNQAEQTVASLQQGLSLRSSIGIEQTDLVVEQTRAQQTRAEQAPETSAEKNKQSDNTKESVTELLKLAKLNIPNISAVIENGENLIQTDLIEFDSIVVVNDKIIEFGENKSSNKKTDEEKNDKTKTDNTKAPEKPRFSPLLEIAKISVADIEITNNGVLVTSVDINKVNSAINKQANGSVLQLNALLSPSSTTTTETPQEAASNTANISPVTGKSQAVKANRKPEPADTKQEKGVEDKASEQENSFRFYVGKISLSDDLILAVTDRSVSPSYSNNIKVSTFTLEPIDSEKPSVTTKVTVAGAFDQYSKFSINADVEPFKKDKYVKADITVSEFDLSTTTAYVQQFMAIESGHLNTVSSFVINGEQINGNAQLNLSRVELSESFDYDSSIMVDSFIPVNLALSMLKDSDGNIELDVPIDGDLNSPDFRLSGFMSLLVQRATMAATKEYLMNAFVPYASIVQIGMQAGEFILKVRFQDLILTTGEDELPESASEFLNEFSALMIDKEDTQITVCALSTKSDIGIESTEKLTVKQLDKLNQLSLNRMKNFKDLMVDEYKIKSSRLLLCAPRVDNDKDAKPRLTFSN